jgi:hypothetical protein
MENESQWIQVGPHHIHYTKRNVPLVHINTVQLTQDDDVNYLGLHLDRRLTWHKHILAKRKQLGFTLTKTYWLLGRTNFSYIKQYSNQSGLTEYNSGVQLPIPT